MAASGHVFMRRSAIPSTVLERRFPLFDERPHPFLLIVEREGRMEFAALEQQAFGQRRFVRAIDRLLELEDGRQREASDLRRDCQGFRLQLVRRHDARDRRWVPPMPGIVPIVISGWPNFAVSAAMMKSQAIASSQPPPSANPATA